MAFPMIRRHLASATIPLVVLALASSSQDRDRSKIADQYKWDFQCDLSDGTGVA